MNFFEHQDIARRKTKWLVAIYAATLVSMIVAVHLLICLALMFYQMDKGTGQTERALRPNPGRFDTPERDSHEAPSFQTFLWRVDIFALATLGVLTVVGLGSVWKHYEMRAGGPAIAEWLGGRQIFYESNVPLERKIWNVVEEMAIASGTPVPSVYLLDQEKGINAFAAGSSANDAVIGVSFGCAEELSRDELQGVIAHEFSHILHGDMRLNMRLIGILAGITLLSYIGYLVFRLSWGGGSSSRSSSGKKGGGGIGAVIMLVGLGIYLIGSLGALAAAIIQAAISRQREFLADASAVQYTRNPIGISGALRAIGASLTGSRIQHARAGEVRHMFFGQGIKTMFATHPPLRKRISRIESGWDDVHVDGIQDPVSGAAVGLAGVAGFAGGPPTSSSLTPELSQPTKMPVDHKVELLTSIGDPKQEHIDYAKRLIKQLPENLNSAVRECFSARGVVYGLLISHDPVIASTQMDELKQRCDATLIKTVATVLPELQGLDARLRVPLLDMAKGILKEMSPAQYGEFRQAIEVLIKADDRLSLFEWVVKRSVVAHLDIHYGQKKRNYTARLRVAKCYEEIRLLLSTIAHAGHKVAEDAASSYQQAVQFMGIEGLKMSNREDCSLKGLDQAMDRLSRLRPEGKQRLISACVTSVAADGRVSQMEAELLRVFSEMLGCPVPPLLPGQEFSVQSTPDGPTV